MYFGVVLVVAEVDRCGDTAQEAEEVPQPRNTSLARDQTPQRPREQRQYDDHDQDRRWLPVDEGPKQQVAEVAKDHTGESKVDAIGPAHQPDRQTRTERCNRTHREERSDAAGHGEPAEDDERHGIGSYMAEAHVQKRGDDDPRKAPQASRSDAERVEIHRQQHVDEFDGPHQYDDPDQYRNTFANPLDSAFWFCPCHRVILTLRS